MSFDFFAWFGLNLFCWPSGSPRTTSLRTTYANAARFFLLNPTAGLILTGLSLILTLASIVLTLPFTLALACWLASVATVAVQQSLERRRSRS